MVHVVKEPYPIGVEGDVPDISGFRKSILETAHRQLDTLLAATPGASGVVLVGPPAGRIIENAAECNADLIVMGTHGRGALTRLVLGSVAARVVRTAHCPVLTIRDDGTGTRTNGRLTSTAATGAARGRS